MNRNERINYHIDAIAQEVFGYITENSDKFESGWVPAATIKNDLNLNLLAVPKNQESSSRGWLFGIIARRLEDMGIIDYDNSGTRSFCRIAKSDIKQ